MKKGIIAIICCISWVLNAQVALPTFQAVNALPSLYSFSSHTFTHSGATGYNGPTLSNCKSAYGASWVDDTDFFNVQTRGIQEWTVPANGTYSFVLKGASGGRGYTNGNAANRGGYGSQVSGSIALTKGHVIKIVVGQKGVDSNGSSSCSSSSGGGGGGTFVYNSTTSTLLFAAGAGAGGATRTANSGIRDASLTTTGKTSEGSSPGAGGSSGAGGSVAGGCVAGGGAGGGYSGSGASASSAPGGTHFTSTAVGGNSGYRDGGFGGGGASGDHAGGGGGGYSGGGGGGLPSCTCSDLASGGGGSSYDSTSNATISLLSSSGHGQVTVTRS